MVKARKYVVKRRFEGKPKRDDFEIVEYELPPLKENEILVKTEWISVDPVHRYANTFIPIPYDQFGFQIGKVLESKDAKYPVGSKIVSQIGWCDYTILKESQYECNIMYKLPNLEGLPTELGIGEIGMPGATAYFGFLEICKPKSGETVVVTGAAGAVGYIVGQIAKIKGCRVIGFTGSDAKVKWLEEEIGFDKAINYKTADITKALKEAAPNGVDCYFDNVGGEISSIILSHMNLYGRVSVCGSMSTYNSDPKEMPKALVTQVNIVIKELLLEGFIVTRWSPEKCWQQAFTDIIKWIKSGQIKYRSHITVGFDNVFDAFIGMLDGENFGKACVKI